MKVIDAETMAIIESKAYLQGHSPQEFMEEAGNNIGRGAQVFIKEKMLGDKVLLLCGKGNNGGDAFVAGCHLLNQGFRVTAIQIESPDKCSPLCQQNGLRFLNLGGSILKEYPNPITGYGVILDGLFGTGFRGEVKEPYASLINAANASHIPILAVDIPSGLNGTTGEVLGPVIKAAKTFFLGLPKTGFFLRNGWEHVGELEFAAFGMPHELIDLTPAVFDLLRMDELSLPPINRTWHKYQRGYVMGLAGSPGMPGAALLASLAALRAGSGMVRLLHPDGMQAELAFAPYEVIRIPYKNEEAEDVMARLNKATSNFIGPGIGKAEKTADFLNRVVPRLEKPVVIDADGLSLLAEKPFDLPKQTILTPHTGEMERLLPEIAPFSYTKEALKKCQIFAEQRKVTLILKGPITFIFHPGKTITVNTVSDPGMATAGSGDVLTGILASLLAQGLDCYNASRLGVFLHGLAGHIAADKKTSRGMIASDIIAEISSAFKKFEN